MNINCSYKILFDLLFVHEIEPTSIEKTKEGLLHHDDSQNIRVLFTKSFFSSGIHLPFHFVNDVWLEQIIKIK